MLNFLERHSISVAFFIIFAIVTGCVTSKRHDGPPTFYVDETKIPDAVPKSERPSKYGNMAAYNVLGKRYYVMPSAHQYQERGIASWYGSKFNAQKTSSGEPYNMLAMTAAHKTLPLPTYVEVTNLSNHKKIIVKVNDRGPFAPNRIIDLSYVAAKKLGMLGHGTAFVEVKAIDTTQAVLHPNLLANATSQTSPLISNGLFIQAGSFKNKVLAEQLQRRLGMLLASPVHVQYAENYYRVKVGPIQSKEKADQIHHQLKSLKLLAVNDKNYASKIAHEKLTT